MRLDVTQNGDQLVILFVGGTKKRQQADIMQAEGTARRVQRP